MPREPRSNCTIKATGRAGKGQRQRLEQILNQECELYNSALRVLESAHQNYTSLELQHLELQLTKVREEYPEFTQIHRKLSITTLKRAVTAWEGHTNPREGTTPRGKPRQKNTERFRTIALDSPEAPIIRSSIQAGNPYLCIKGLPNLRITTHRELPEDQQPSRVSITLRSRRISIRLTYQQPPYPKSKPVRELRKTRGIDLGVAITAMTSSGTAYTSPNEDRLNQKIKEAQQTLARKRNAAIRLGLGASRARLDNNNHQVVSSRGRPQHQIVWLGEPTSAYRRAQEQLQELYEKRNNLRNDFRHRVTTEVVRQAITDQVNLLATEELQITNMTRSAMGTTDRPGRNVRAKSGLNRSILRQGWGDFKTKLDYKAAKAGIRHVEIHPGGTSQTCNQCGERDPRSRVSQSEFQCTSCSYSANADMNAAINIGDRGLYYLQKRLGKTQKHPASQPGLRSRLRGENWKSSPQSEPAVAHLKAQKRELQGVTQFSQSMTSFQRKGYRSDRTSPTTHPKDSVGAIAVRNQPNWRWPSSPMRPGTTAMLQDGTRYSSRKSSPAYGKTIGPSWERMSRDG